MVNNMSEANDLLRLQEIDTKIRRAKTKVKELPELKKIVAFQSQEKEISKKHLSFIASFKDLKYEYEELKNEEATLLKNINELKQKRSTLSNYRRIQELDDLLASRSKSLDKVQYTMANREEEIAKYEDLEDKFDVSFKQLADKKEHYLHIYQSKVQNIKKDLAEDLEERDELVSKISDETLALYEQSCKKHSGVGVGKLEDKQCSACRSTLQDGYIYRLTANPGINTCPYCKRLLVVEP